MTVHARWQTVQVDTQNFLKQNPPLTKVAAATIVGMESILAQVELGRKDCEFVGLGANDDVPFVIVQHTDDDHRPWDTCIEFTQMKGHQVWCATVFKDHLKLVFVKELA